MNDPHTEQKLCLQHWTRALRCVLKGEWQAALEYHASAECPIEVLFPGSIREDAA